MQIVQIDPLLSKINYIIIIIIMISRFEWTYWN